MRFSRAAYYRTPRLQLEVDAEVVAALQAIVERHPSHGFWKCYRRMRRQGRPWNHKRVHRVYCALKLNLPRRAKRRLPKRLRQPLDAPAVLNGVWALDFMSDALYDGREFRTLNVLDEGNREALAIDVAFSLPSARVIRVLDELEAVHGRPQAVRVDNGPSATGRPSLKSGRRSGRPPVIPSKSSSRRRGRACARWGRTS